MTGKRHPQITSAFSLSSVSLHNKHGYVGGILECQKCGKDVVRCHGELWEILSCTKRGHEIRIKDNPDKTYEVL